MGCVLASTLKNQELLNCLIEGWLSIAFRMSLWKAVLPTFGTWKTVTELRPGAIAMVSSMSAVTSFAPPPGVVEALSSRVHDTAGTLPDTICPAALQTARPVAQPSMNWLGGGYLLASFIAVHTGYGFVRAGLGEKALQRVAGWPGESGDLASALLELIDRRLADPAVSEDERGRLERLREALSDVGKGVVTGLLTGLVKSRLG